MIVVLSENAQSAGGPGRGRRSHGHGPRVLGCEPVPRGEGIVPAAQAFSTVAHDLRTALPVLAGGPQSHSLMPLLSGSHLRRALRQCGRRASAPGADGMTWGEFRRHADRLLLRLADELADGTWRPGPVREVVMTTYTGKRLRTVVPSVRDRVVHRALRNAIEPILETYVFQDWVSGFRRRRNRLTALRQAMVHHRTGLRWVADVDVASVSDGADLDEVIDWHAEHIHDGTFLRRLRTALSVMPTPLVPGSGVSPMLVNLRLSQADKRLSSLRVVRFADNYAAFADSQREAEEAFYAISDALLVLRLHPNGAKSRIRALINVEDLFLIGG